MKVLKETTDIQTLKIIPRIYPDEVDLTIRNETTREETTFLSLPSVFNSGYLDIASDFIVIADPSLKESEYFQFDFTPATGKTLELSSIEFEISSRVLSRPVGNFALAYSVNSDFSDSVSLIGYPDGDISLNTISTPLSVNHTFDSVIVLTDAETIYFRIYPYNAFDATGPQMIIIRDTFFINGTIQGGSIIPSQLLAWPLNDSVSDSYNTFTFDLANIISANYTLAGIIDDTGTPFVSGGIWRYLPINETLFSFKEDTSYTIEVRETIANGSEVIYKDKIFCTNQDDYSILDGKYTAREQNRKYTVR